MGSLATRRWLNWREGRVCGTSTGVDSCPGTVLSNSFRLFDLRGGFSSSEMWSGLLPPGVSACCSAAASDTPSAATGVCETPPKGIGAAAAVGRLGKGAAFAGAAVRVRHLRSMSAGLDAAASVNPEPELAALFAAVGHGFSHSTSQQFLQRFSLSVARLPPATCQVQVLSSLLVPKA